VSEQRLRAYERWTAWPLTLSAVLFLVVYAWPVLQPGLDPRWARACALVNLVVWVAFGVDLALRFTLTPRRRHFLRTHVFDVVVLALPLLRPLRVLRVLTVFARMNRVHVTFRGQTAMYVAGTLVLLGFVASIAVLDAERGQAQATIRTFGDALWWTATTITTVGYGDLYPVTTEGRFVGAGLMLGGIALVGVVTATLASWFVEKVGARERAEVRLRREVGDLVAEVRQLRAEVAGRSPATPEET
jgi:voltage-gated potassium channel